MAANRGYIFEAVWAASIAARFYKRFGQTRRLQQMQRAYESKSIGLENIGRLPPVNATDVQNMIIRLFGGEARSFTMRTQPDVVFDQQIEDYSPQEQPYPPRYARQNRVECLG